MNVSMITPYSIDLIPFPVSPITFMSPNQALQPDTVKPSLNLSCTVVNNGTFYWTWSGPGVNNAVMKLADATRTSILMLSDISTANAGNYTCSASYQSLRGYLNGQRYYNAIKPDIKTTNNISLTLFSKL